MGKWLRIKKAGIYRKKSEKWKCHEWNKNWAPIGVTTSYNIYIKTNRVKKELSNQLL